MGRNENPLNLFVYSLIRLFLLISNLVLHEFNIVFYH